MTDHTVDQYDTATRNQIGNESFFEGALPVFTGIASGLSVHTGMSHEQIMAGSQAPTGLEFVDEQGRNNKCLGNGLTGGRLWEITEQDGETWEWETL